MAWYKTQSYDFSFNIDLIKSDYEHPSKKRRIKLAMFYSVALNVAIFPKLDKIYLLLFFHVCHLAQRCSKSKLLGKNYGIRRENPVSICIDSGLNSKLAL